MTYYEAMPAFSPAHHRLGHIDGDVGAIRQRGTDLTTLATEMTTSSKLLQSLVEDGSDMKGEAIDKLASSAKDVYAELGRAAELYHAVAPYISGYATDLETAKNAIDPILGDLVELWQTYLHKQGDAMDAHAAQPKYPTGDDANDETLRQQAEDKQHDAATAAAGLATSARQAWTDRAKDFDKEWDTWHGAFMHAANGIHDDMSGKIKDSWDDDMRGFLQWASDFLAVAGMVLAVLAIVVGGPIIAALAAVVAIATLVVAVARLARGEGSVLDVVFGVIGVIPVLGPAAKFLRGPAAALHEAEFGADLLRLTGRGATSVRGWASGLNGLEGLTATERVGDFCAKLFTGKGASDLLEIDGGLKTLDMVGNVFASHFAIAGGIKDSAGGAWGGAFAPGQNPFG